MRIEYTAVLLAGSFFLVGCASTAPRGSQDNLDVIRVLKPEAFTEVGLYRIKPGDTALKIARTHGITIEALRSMNPDVDWQKLKVWQVVRIRDQDVDQATRDNSQSNPTSEGIRRPADGSPKPSM